MSVYHRLRVAVTRPSGSAALLLVAWLAGTLAARAQEVGRFRVSQVHQIAAADTRVRAYLDVVGADGEPAAEVAADQLSATLGERRLALERLEPMRGSGEGVAYIFLVDISRSLSGNEFARIVEEIEAWISDLTRADRAAIITFGEQVRLAVDFTGDREELVSTLWSLGPTDDLTLLYRALDEALELAQRRDPDLPGRRALVVLTDGRDEGSSLAADDVLARLRRDPSPLYAIGHSRLRDPASRRRYLDLLERFAANSGGAFFEADRTQFAEAYSAIKEAVHRVWLAELSCADCPADGREYRFQATLDLDGRVLSDGRAVRVFPRAIPPPSADTEPAPDRPVAPATEPAAARRPWWRRPLTWIGAAVAVALLALLRWLLRPQGEPKPQVAGDEAEEEPAPPKGIDAPLPPPLTPRPPPSPKPRSEPLPVRRGPVRLRGVRLVVVRGSKPGRQYRLVLEGRAVVGSRSTCDCVLANEPGVEAEQFALTEQGGQIYISNLATQQPTLLDGLPIEEHQPVKSDDLIGTGEVILRIVLD